MILKAKVTITKVEYNLKTTMTKMHDGKGEFLA